VNLNIHERKTMSWTEIRGLFPALKEVVYLNNASASPIPEPVAVEYMALAQQLQRAGDTPWDEWLGRIGVARQRVADLLGANEECIGLIPNTSYGMNVVAHLLRDAGEVLFMRDEFPATTIPFVNLGCQVRFVEPQNGRYNIGSVENRITEQTRILATSHVQFATGFRHNLEELGDLCKKRGLVFVVNATQSIGCAPIDVVKDSIDFLAFSGVKTLCTGAGTGGLYVSSDRLGGRPWPLAGWLSTSDPSNYENAHPDFQRSTSAIEIGAPNLGGIFALERALRLFEEVGFDTVHNRILDLAGHLHQSLVSAGFPLAAPASRDERLGTIAVPISHAVEHAARLAARGIIVSARRGMLRASVHIYNTRDDIERFVNVLREIAA
jgi:cysteine desulfurase / selenocysteine lyase